MHGKHQHLHLGMACFNNPGKLQPFRVGHADFDKHEIGFAVFQHFQVPTSIVRLSNYLLEALLFEDGLHPIEQH